MASARPKSFPPNHRQAEQRNQRRTNRSQNQGAVRRPWRDGASGLARRFWEADRPGNREVGQGDPSGKHQGRVVRAANFFTTSKTLGKLSIVALCGMGVLLRVGFAQPQSEYPLPASDTHSLK